MITRVLVALITTQWGNHRHIPLFLAFPSISRKICDLLNVPTQQSPINSARIRSSKVTKYRLEDGRCIISHLHNPDLNTMNGDRLFFQRNNTDLCRFNCDAQRGVRYALKLDRMESLQLWRGTLAATKPVMSCELRQIRMGFWANPSKLPPLRPT